LQALLLVSAQPPDTHSQESMPWYIYYVKLTM
jgi:hypothetical protein